MPNEIMCCMYRTFLVYGDWYIIRYGQVIYVTRTGHEFKSALDGYINKWITQVVE